MYGKIYQCTFSGSMVGSGATVFAVWGYVIAHAQDGTVDLNPVVVGAILGEPPDRIVEAIEFLCRPDDDSRNKEHEGRRLVKTGAFSYVVVSHVLYRDMRSSADLRAYNREKQRESRARRKASIIAVNDRSMTVIDVNHTDTDTDTDTEAKAEAEKSSTSLSRKRSETKRGTRLPDDWKPSETDLAFASSLNLSPSAVAATFADYWHSVPGTKGVKLDWPATWRNWCRNEAKRQPMPTGARARTAPNAAALDALERFRQKGDVIDVES